MSKAKHTPGPWVKRGRVIVSESGLTVARLTDNETGGFDCPSHSEAEANGITIAAATDLLDALKDARPWVVAAAEYQNDALDALQALDEAIAKATTP